LQAGAGLGHPLLVTVRAGWGLALLVALALGAPVAVRAHVGLDELDRQSERGVARAPENAEAHLTRARVLEMKHEWDAAIAELEAAAERGADPDVVGAAKGEVFLAAGFPRTAKIELDRVLARRPDAAGARQTRARVWLALGNAEAAAIDFGEAIARASHPTPELVIERRDALLATGHKAEALAALDDGMARIGHVASLEMPAIDLEVELGHTDRALARLDRLAATAPPNPFWIARRGEILARAGRDAEARAEYAKAMALIDARDAAHRGRPFDDLKRRLETALAPTTPRGDLK